MGFRGGLCLYQVWWSSFLRYRVEKQTDKQTNKRRWTPYPRVPLSRTEWSLSLLQRLPMLFSGPVNPKIAHSRERISTPPPNNGSLGPRESATKPYLDRFSRFCRAHERDQQTDTQTDRPSYSAAMRPEIHYSSSNFLQLLFKLWHNSCWCTTRHSGRRIPAV